MKIQIRKGCFETNSSSMHCLVIADTEEVFDQRDLEYAFWSWGNEDEIETPKLYFGRSPFKVLTDVKDKFFYVLGALSQEFGDKYWDECSEFIKKHLNKRLVPNEKSDCRYFKTEEEAIDFANKMNKTLKEKGLEDFEVKPTKSEYSNSWEVEDCTSIYVEDYGRLKTFFEERNLTVEDFVLHKKYIIIVDGDEYRIWEDIKQLGIINTNLEEVSLS